jgi:hypothetical protein
MGPGGETGGQSVGRLDMQGPFQQLDRLGIGFHPLRPEMRHRLHDQIIGLEAVGSFPLGPLDLGRADGRVDRSGNLSRNLILQVKNAGGLAFELVGPDVDSRVSGYQLGGHS